MTREEYQQKAVSLESPLNDTDQVGFNPAFLVTCTAIGRIADRIKRESFYQKKPDAAYDSKTESELVTMDQSLNTLKTECETLSDMGIDHRILHSVLGLITETAEIVEEIVSAASDMRPINLDNMREEFSDLEWYLALGRDACEKADGNQGRFTQESIQNANIAKLFTRYKRDPQVQYGGERDRKAEEDAMRKTA